MLKHFVLASLLFVMLSVGVNAESLAQIGDVDLETIATLKGQWALTDSRFSLTFTDQFANVIYGLKYYYYSRSNTKTSYPWVYTIVKSKKTKQFYFARGSYQNGRFIGNTSRIEFKSKDKFVVYSSTNPRQIYFIAYRIKPIPKK